MLALQVIGEVGKGLRESPRLLTRAHHGDIELGENIWMLGERLRDLRAALDVISNVYKLFLEQSAPRLACQQLECREHGDFCFKERRNLPREDDDVARLDALKDFENVFRPARLLVGHNGEHDKVALLERADGGINVCGINGALLVAAVFRCNVVPKNHEKKVSSNKCRGPSDRKYIIRVAQAHRG